MKPTSRLPRCRGVYLLALKMSRELRIRYGFREESLSPGIYMYVGSAMGGGGIKGRITRHLRRSKPIHWHIDRLTSTPGASVILISYLCTERREAESILASACRTILKPGPPGFGCSDKPKDKTHLYKVTGINPAEAAEKCFVKALGSKPKTLWMGIHGA